MLRTKTLAAAVVLFTSACATAPPVPPFDTGSKAVVAGFTVVTLETVWANDSGGTVFAVDRSRYELGEWLRAEAEALDFSDVDALERGPRL
jgi:hypothetical protein